MRRLPSLRLRLAVLVALLSFGVLAGIAAVVVHVVDGRMHDTVRSSALQALDQARVSLAAGVSLDAPGAVSPGEPTVRVTEGDEPSRATMGCDLPDPPAGDTEVVRCEPDGKPAYVAVTAIEGTDGGTEKLAAAAPLEETERTLATLRAAALVVVPTAALLLGGLAALVASRALRPVATMRGEADAISHGTLHHRLSVAAPSSELAGLAGTMNHMLDRLERAATGQRRFVSDVSHEFRSPLATIRGTVELGPADGRDLALGEIDRLDRLVGDLLTLARLDEHGLTPVDVDLEDVIALHVAAVRRPGLAVDITGVRPARITADRRAMDGLVRNLLDNAARHAAGVVAVGLVAASDHIELLVDDDGLGIPANQRNRVFERFARLDDGRSRDAGGTGLGLAVAAAAANAQGGTITIVDAPLGGARFRVRLPVVSVPG